MPEKHAIVVLMKKLLLSLSLVAFAVAVQAGDAKDSKDASPCCSKQAGTQAKGTCPMANQAKGGCCKDASAKQALLSPKAAGEVSKRL